eukprot:TRINITY_DN34594_c0_g1_i1.p1 TRINITY_DN34594_c0_g1~~TRINITY_DN34594_c0_g1_i1.p1  ORF type:complete len:583 (+),score=186.66 TRINITY_DN34594_c0_g1_i1:80-1828(+)
MSPPQKRNTVWVKGHESSFLSKVQSSNGFQKVMGSYSKSLGVPIESSDLQSFAEDLSKCCLHEADEFLGSEGRLGSAMREIRELKEKLTQCQLATMKQMAAVRAGNFKAEMHDDIIVFHEPLQFLDEAQKELVLTIVNDKVRQLQYGTAPPSLLEALTRHANSAAAAGDGASLEELRETQAQLEQARSEARMLRGQLERAEGEVEDLQGQLKQVRAKLADTENELAKVKQEKQALQAENEKLRAVTAQQKAEIERQQVEIQRQELEIKRLDQELQEERQANVKLREEVHRLEELTAKQQAQIEEQEAEIERQRVTIVGLEQELQEERQANEQLRAEVLNLQEEMRQLQKQLAQLQALYDALKKEADEMRAELARRNNTRTQGTQTALTGQKIDERAEETKRLKVMLEEMQMKLKELVEKYRKKFGQEAKEVAKELGIEQLLKEDTVFQRLYDDALERVDRLEKLRAKIRKESKNLGVPSEPTEVPVLAAVEGSDLRNMRRFLGGEQSPEPAAQAATPSPLRERSPAPAKAPPAFTERSPIPPKVLQPSVSLPSLRTVPQNMSVLNLNLGQKQRSRPPGSLFS